MTQNPIHWFRHSLPYINTHRGKTFVIMMGSETVNSPNFTTITQDIALLHSLGIRLVLVHGARHEIDATLANASVASGFYDGVRITPDTAITHVVSAVATVRTNIESRFCGGLSNTPLHGSKITTISGNFITAKPFGVRDGVDYLLTGEVRRVDKHAISHNLSQGYLVIISPLGFSSTGELYNLEAFDVAKCVAIALNADKLIIFNQEQGVFVKGKLIKEMTVSQAISHRTNHPALPNAISACQAGVSRVHLLSHHDDGALLKELFTTDGYGTMISQNPFDAIRYATPDDVMGIMSLIKPLEKQGILVARSRERLEEEIEFFCVIERDGKILGCAGLYPLDNDSAEIASVAIDPNYRDGNRGADLLKFVETWCLSQGRHRLFALTTRTLHWFLERGFCETTPNSLPPKRHQAWHNGRNSKVLLKKLGDHLV